MTRHGIVVVPEHRWREAAPRWAAAEQLGFDHAWTYDHLVWAGLPDSPVLRVRADARRWRPRSPRRSASGCSWRRPNFRHPYVLARDAITLDDASGGRFLLGMGAGGDLDSRILGEDRAAPAAGRPARTSSPSCSSGCSPRTTSTTTASSTPPVDARTLPEPVRERGRRSSWRQRSPLGAAGRPARRRAGRPRWQGRHACEEWFDHVARAWSPASTTSCARAAARGRRPLPAARRLAPLRAGVGRPLRRDDRPRRRARLHRRRHPLAAPRGPVRRASGATLRASPRGPPSPPLSQVCTGQARATSDHRVGRRLGRTTGRLDRHPDGRGGVRVALEQQRPLPVGVGVEQAGRAGHRAVRAPKYQSW